MSPPHAGRAALVPKVYRTWAAKFPTGGAGDFHKIVAWVNAAFRARLVGDKTWAVSATEGIDFEGKVSTTFNGLAPQPVNRTFQGLVCPVAFDESAGLHRATPVDRAPLSTAIASEC